MRKILLATIITLACISAAQADTTLTFRFDPNDWINSYSTDVTKTRVQQDNPRILIDGVAQATDNIGYAGTHTTYAGASYSSTGIAGFANQVAGVEIHDFNMWLDDGINAPNWGEVLVQAGGSIPSGTAGNGWAAVVIDNPWPQGAPGQYGGKLIQWYDVGYWDDDPNTASNALTFNGTDFDLFSLTVTVLDTDVDGNPVNPNKAYRIWLGTMLPETWTVDPDDLVYSGNRRYEGTMTLTPIPAPGAALLAAIGLGLIGWLKRRIA